MNTFTSIETVTKSVTVLCVGMAEALPGQETECKEAPGGAGTNHT